MHLKTVFLNDDLYKKNYMEHPEGLLVPSKEKKACKLVKS